MTAKRHAKISAAFRQGFIDYREGVDNSVNFEARSQGEANAYRNGRTDAMMTIKVRNG